MILIIRK